ncbi:hypothetical protein Bca101_026596 [Brassica carinata]
MARFAKQDEIQKETQAQLAALVAALTAAPVGQTSNPRPFRRQLFNTNPTSPVADHTPEELEPTEPLPAEAAPVGPDLTTIREMAELKLNFQQMSSTIHKVTSAAQQIESVLASTERTPFTSTLTDVNFCKLEKMRVPQYTPGGCPVEHMTAFNIAMARARLPDDEKDAAYCQLFLETLHEQALTWFSGLSENSISSFRELSSALLKTYIMFAKRETTASSLWNLKQTKDQSLRDFMERFKSVVSKIDIPDHIAIDALMNILHLDSKFREDLDRSPSTSFQDAIARSHNFICMEEDTKAILVKHGAAKPATPKTAEAKQEPRQHAPVDKNNPKNVLLFVVDENN